MLSGVENKNCSKIEGDKDRQRHTGTHKGNQRQCQIMERRDRKTERKRGEREE